MNALSERSIANSNQNGWDFHSISIGDQKLFADYIKKTEYPVNIWSSSFAYLWAISQASQREVLWCQVNGMLAVFSHTRSDRLFLLCLPFGPGDAEHVAETTQKCLQFCLKWNDSDVSDSMVKLLNESQLAFLMRAHDFRRTFRAVTWIGIERHYDVPKLAALKGKDFEKLRNRINKFKRDHPSAAFERYRRENFDEVMELGERWKQTSGKKYANVFDSVYYREIIRNNDELGQVTYLMRENGKLIGMISGAVLATGEAWGSLVKFKEGIPGLSETLIIYYIRELNRIDPRIHLLNVGSDLGPGGLREYKLKFHPVLNLKRYKLTLRVSEPHE